MFLSPPDNDTDEPDPTDPAPALPVPARARAAAIAMGGTVDLFYVACRLGQGHRSTRWRRAYLDRLIAAQGFPPPFPLPAGDGLSTAVAAASRWPRDAVDAWLDGRHAVPIVEGIDAAAHAAAQARLAASAGTLRDRIRIVAGGRA